MPSDKQVERRFLSAAGRPIELRADEGKPPMICGYGAVYYRADDPGSEYEILRFGNYSVCERLMPGCFDRAIREDDVRGMMNHDPSLLLGRVRAGTMRLFVDSIGLRYEIDSPDTSYARDLIESLKRGDLSGSSFSFDYIKKDVIFQQDGDKERDIIEVRDVKLYDTGPVSMPAYTSTTAGIRSVNEDALKRELDALRGERLRNAPGKRARARLLDL